MGEQQQRTSTWKWWARKNLTAYLALTAGVGLVMQGSMSWATERTASCHSDSHIVYVSNNKTTAKKRRPFLQLLKRAGHEVTEFTKTHAEHTDTRIADHLKSLPGDITVLTDGISHSYASTNNSQAFRCQAIAEAGYPLDIRFLAFQHEKGDRNPPQQVVTVIPVDPAERQRLKERGVPVTQPIPRELNPNIFRPTVDAESGKPLYQSGKPLHGKQSAIIEQKLHELSERDYAAPGMNIHKRINDGGKEVDDAAVFNLYANIQRPTDLVQALCAANMFRATLVTANMHDVRVNILTHSETQKSHSLRGWLDEHAVVSMALQHRQAQHFPASIVAHHNLNLPELLQVSHGMLLTPSTTQHDVLGAAISMVPLFGTGDQAQLNRLVSLRKPASRKEMRMKHFGESLWIDPHLLAQVTGETVDVEKSMPFHWLGFDLQKRIIRHTTAGQLRGERWHYPLASDPRNRATFHAFADALGTRKALMRGTPVEERTVDDREVIRVLAHNHRVALGFAEKPEALANQWLAESILAADNAHNPYWQKQ